MTTATVGLIGGILLGIVIINWGIKKGYTSQVKAAAKSSTEMRTGLYAKDAELPEMCKQTTIPNSIETLSLHLALIIGVSAIMSINVKLLSTYWVALAITCVLGLVVTPLCIIFICKKFCRTNWFEKSLGCIGANTGVFVTGILLIKMVDPDIKTDALTDYSIGGTLCNLFAMPLISLAIGIMGSSGPIAALVFSVITSIACFAPILVSGLTIGRKKKAE